MGKYLLSILFCVMLLPTPAQAKTKYVIDYFKIMVRSQPGAEYKIIDQLPSNEKVRTIQKEGNWVKIAFKNNRTGWVLQQFLTTELPKGIRIAELEKKSERAGKENSISRRRKLFP